MKISKENYSNGHFPNVLGEWEGNLKLLQNSIEPITR